MLSHPCPEAYDSAYDQANDISLKGVSVRLELGKDLGWSVESSKMV